MYQIQLESYHGPLDLLLYLVRKNEVDILDIPIAQIASEFLNYLHLIQQVDIEWAGDFLVMAATLMEIKSKLLLPQQPTTESTAKEDPRQEIVRQLIEYRRTKQAANKLEELSDEQQFHISRIPVEDPDSATSPKFRSVELWDLVSAFARLIRETQTHEILSIGIDDTPQTTYQTLVKNEVAMRGRLSLAELIGPVRTRVRIIGYFLAILELLKQGDILLEQPEEFGMIWLVPRDMPRLAHVES